MEGIPNKAPLDEVEIYRGLVKNCCHQLGILKVYDPKFVFLETQLLMHLEQVDATITVMKQHVSASA